MVEVSINAKQAIAIIWTLFAFGLSLAVVLTYGASYYPSNQWQMLIVLFFALMLIIALPAYLFLALWQIMSKSDNA
jgi:FtsH-binding integral membrane protein